MLCQKCKQREATRHIRSVVDGVVNDSYLCEKCAESLKVTDIYGSEIFKILSSLINDTKEEADTPRCDCCGISFNEISRTGRVGCARCYKFFEKQLRPAIAKIHGTTTHAGKVPQRPENNAEDTAGTEKNRVEELKMQLKAAVENEEYEKAAQLRDEIKGLEGER